MKPKPIPASGNVEAWFLKQAPIPFLDRSREKIPTLVVDNYVALGQVTALRFLEWVAQNPAGVAALPTGRSPEYFIKWVTYYLTNWKKECQKGIVGAIGLGKTAPVFSGLTFVQLDEFFPITAGHARSFYRYVNKYYIQGFGFNPRKALFINAPEICEKAGVAFNGKTGIEAIFPEGKIDLALRQRHPISELENAQRRVIKFVDQFCEDYEDRIRKLGGIGFFLGGIGLDGHVAFNIKGSSHFSTTRLINLNYETQAAAAQDLGGMEAVRKKAVITIGLGTISANPNVVALIIAAGQSKARVIADALEQEAHIDYPASSLQKLAHARFYLTAGAASALSAR
ncbi:MAG: 6-phosphogluconolactonase, partial [Chitinivibrionales bacterium]|nr:6-phosphogluconolactonase [Chitinivibrionales bacterium]